MAELSLPQIVALLKAGDPDAPFEEMRASLDATTNLLPLPEGTRRERVDANGVAAEWFEAPGVSRERAVLYAHGGAYVTGSAETHRELTARLSAAADARVLSVDYRLAPEHRFPAALDDLESGWRWLRSQGFEASRLAVGGDSAGGGLAVALLLRLRDAGEALPAAAAVLSPWVDLTASGDSLRDPICLEQDWLHPRLAERGARAYLGEAGDAETPEASPLHGDLGGLPPLFVQVGDVEILRDDARRLVERAERAGVKATLDLWPGMPHWWQLFASFAPEGAHAIERAGGFLRQRMA